MSSETFSNRAEDSNEVPFRRENGPEKSMSSLAVRIGFAGIRRYPSLLG